MSLNSTKRKLWAAALGMVLAGSGAWAGLSETTLVTIDTLHEFAQGALQAARSSADTVQYIKCSATVTSVSCEAKTSTGTVASCTSPSSHSQFQSLFETVLAINASSRVSFSYDTGGGGTCAAITVQNSSTHLKS